MDFSRATGREDVFEQVCSRASLNWESNATGVEGGLYR